MEMTEITSSEVAVLGSIILDNRVYDDVRKYVSESDFIDFRNRIVYSCICELFDDSKPVDLISLHELVKKRGNNVHISYLSSLTNNIPSSANAEYYAKMVKEDSDRRKLLDLSDKLRQNAMNKSMSAAQLREEIEQVVYGLGEYGESDYQHIRQYIHPALEKMEWRQTHPGEYSGVPSGLTELDEMLDGFQNSEFILVGARPSIGKTAFALTLADNIAVRKKIPAGFFTLEMSGKTITHRMFSINGRIDSSRIRNGTLKASDFTRLMEVGERLSDSGLFVFDKPNAKLQQVKSAARRMVKREGVKIIFIDYVGLITDEDENKARHEQISRISRGLKSLARELDIPVVVLTQVTRVAEGKRPTLADIRDSGSLEQDADVVMFLHRERDSETDVVPTELIVSKQRNGPVGTVNIMMHKQYTRFEMLEKHKEER